MNDILPEMIPVPPPGFLGLSKEEWTFIILFIVWLEPKITRFLVALKEGNTVRGSVKAGALGSAQAPRQNLLKQSKPNQDVISKT